VRAVDRERQVAEVRRAADGRDQRRDEVRHEGCDERREGRADHDCHGQIDQIASQQEVPEASDLVHSTLQG
jgi:hypothetical protein